MSDVTRILERVERGDGTAADELLPLVYEELRKLAALKMADQPAGQRLQTRQSSASIPRHEPRPPARPLHAGQ